MEHGGKRQGAGRPKGAKNKRTVEIEEKLREMDCPFEGMDRIAKAAERKGDLSTAGRMYAELASYRAPKQKSVEVRENKQPGLGLSLDQLQRLKEGILSSDPEVSAILHENDLGYGVLN